MPLITLTDIHRSFGPEVVLDGLQERFFAGEKIGLIGPNGCGKTTIFNLILGNIDPDIGKVIKRKGLRIGYLPQEPVFDGALTVIEQMHAGLESVLGIQRKLNELAESFGILDGAKLKTAMTEYERLGRQFELAGGYEYETKVHTVLAGLGFGTDTYQTKTSALSGGQLSRLGLAKVLMSESDVLLLDEPTNHLDLQATVWLENFLKRSSAAAIVISHDRYLLDSVADRIVEVVAKKTVSWKGNYSKYLTSKEKVRLQQEREHRKRVEMVEKTKDFIARNKDQEGMRGTARGRKKRLERLLAQDKDFLTAPEHQKHIKFSFTKGKGKSDLVLRSEELSKSFDDLLLFEDLTFDVLRGERLGITGPNGTGKSSLLKMALGQLEPTKGTIKVGPSLSVGYLDQHTNMLNPEKTVLQEVQVVRQDLLPEQLRNFLGRFLFIADDVLKTVSQLSGGQQSRLMLCKLVLSEPDVLILDEPTNHLDIQSREMLEDALVNFAGAVIAVSHDRYFLDKVVGKLLVIGSGQAGEKQTGCFEFIGAHKKVYTRYAQLVEKRLEQKEKQKAEKKIKKQKTLTLKHKNAAPKELKRFNKLSTQQIEEMIIELEEKTSSLRERFGDESVYKQQELLAKLQEEFDDAQKELIMLYKAYELREK